MKTSKTFLLLPLLLISTLLKSQCTNTEVLFTTQTQNWGYEMVWRLLNESGEEIASFQDGEDFTLYEETLCLEDGCYTIEAEDTFGDGWNGGSLMISYDLEDFTFNLTEGNEGLFYFGVNQTGCVPIIPGCTDPESINYDPFATVDDGSCINISELIASQVIDTVCYTGSKDNRINWVIQNRGVNNPNNDFTGQEDFFQAFEDDLLKAFTYGDPAAQIPYAQYKNFFNLYAAWWPDAPTDQEWWSFNIIKQMRDELFLPWANDETGWATWFSTTKYGGGGGAGLVRELRVGDGKMYGMGWETLLHEFGHTMPGLLDEYSSNGLWSNGNCWETPNTTGFTTIDDIPWRKWIEPETPLPTPYTEEYIDKYGAFEGAMTNFFGCHRPTARGCYMGAGGFGEDYGQTLCGPCRQRVICFLYRYVNVIENPLPAESNLEVTGNETIHFSAEVLKPEPNTQKYEWFLNGQLIAEGVEEIDVTFGACDQYELVFAVTDTNSLVRYDPKFEDTYPKPYREQKWIIQQTDISSYDFEAMALVQNADCTGAANGNVEFQITGGVAPYFVYQNETLLENPIQNLAAGDYQFKIVDANGCGFSQNVTIPSDALLEPRICSDYDENGWKVWIEGQNYETEDLNFLWSTGDQEASIDNLPNGTYTVEVSTNSGCSITKSINLNQAEEDLNVEALTIASEIGRNTGKIHLDITGGLPPYSIDWEEKINKDVTDANTTYIEASGTTWGHLPEYAFDNSLDDKWLHFVSSDAWISYHVPEGAIVNYYTITSANDVPARDPKDWLFQASNDGDNWVTLDQRTDESFSSRFQKRGFLFNNTTSYTYYRFYVQENHGDGSIQVQQLEFIGLKNGEPFTRNDLAKDLAKRNELASGAYIYTVKDANLSVQKDTLFIGYAEAFSVTGINVIQDGICQVKVETPDPNYEYYWMTDEEGSNILHIGNTFQPPASGNYYVAAVTPDNLEMSQNRKGFALTLEEAPEIETTDENELVIVNPQGDRDYYWYNTKDCSEPLHTGTSYIPTEGTGIYYASALKNTPFPEPIDPTTVDGLLSRMDASDLNGDGIVDDPQEPTSSLHTWQFPTGNMWSLGAWFAYRSNYQNGLGIVDFSTIWLQWLENVVSGYQTIIFAYEENPISFPGTAPFEGLRNHMPKHEDSSQLYADYTPSTTLNGKTFLNGEEVNPLETPNPLSFCILATRMTQTTSSGVRYTDTHWEGKIGEILLYNSAVTDEEIKGISEFLRKKWISVADLESTRTPVYWEGPTSSSEIIKAKKLSLAPNPTSGIVEVKGEFSNSTLQIINMEGKVLNRITLSNGSNVLNVGNLKSGLYIIQVQENDTGNIWLGKLVRE